MGTTALMHFLKSLCDNSYWKFAVFWKVRHGSPMILTWEDGYLHNLRALDSMEIIAQNICGNSMDDIFFPQWETSTYDGSSREYPIELVVADMSHLQYAWGEGVVGEVACTGNHCWVTFEDILSCISMEYKCPAEWLLQFAAGIKTILLVPLLPHGVLQLGSMEEVTEDLAVIHYLKSRFSLLKSDYEDILPSTSKRETELWSSSPSTSRPMENSYVPSNMPTSLAQFGNLTKVDNFRTNTRELSTLYEVEPLLTTKDLSQLGISLAELLGSSCPGEELEAYSNLSVYSNKVFEGSFSSAQIMNAYPEDSAPEAKYANISCNKTMNNIFSFPGHCELHKALGPVLKRQNSVKLSDSSFSSENTGSNCNMLSDVTKPSWFLSEDDAERLLEGVVADLFDILDDTSAGSHSFKSKPASKQFAAPSPPERNLEAGGLMRDDTEPTRSSLLSPATGGNAAPGSSSVSMKSMVSALTEEQQNIVSSCMHSRTVQKTSNLNKRRGRVGDVHRPRPRDRQMIQDRVKELRELVPSGAKCSIDGLFDQTIKHMLFLRRMTEQAEKLKQWVHQEEAARKKLRSANTAGNGRSWVVELGVEVQKNPIVVEDLLNPGHMLIEMLCDEHSFFLKISQVICDSQLKILKGVMECHSNNTWALFIVEASKGFHRMDIFWPLMHLLQHKRILSSWM